jgi:hypothetical protein
MPPAARPVVPGIPSAPPPLAGSGAPLRPSVAGVPPLRPATPPAPPTGAFPFAPPRPPVTPPVTVAPVVTPASPPAAAMPPAPTPATPVSAVSATPVAEAPRRVINPFLANDPNAKAKRLARALISDLVVYHPQRREEGLRNGTLAQLFDEEIRKSREEYVAQVGKEFAESTTHFTDALNEILADGKPVF